MTVYTISRGGLVHGSDGTIRHLDELLDVIMCLRAQREEDIVGLCGGRTYETRQPKPEYL